MSPKKPLGTTGAHHLLAACLRVTHATANSVKALKELTAMTPTITQMTSSFLYPLKNFWQKGLHEKQMKHTPSTAKLVPSHTTMTPTITQWPHPVFIHHAPVLQLMEYASFACRVVPCFRSSLLYSTKKFWWKGLHDKQLKHSPSTAKLVPSHTITQRHKHQHAAAAATTFSFSSTDLFL